MIYGLTQGAQVHVFSFGFVGDYDLTRGALAFSFEYVDGYGLRARALMRPAACDRPSDAAGRNPASVSTPRAT